MSSRIRRMPRPDGVDQLPRRFTDYIRRLENDLLSARVALDAGPADSRLVLTDSLEERKVDDTLRCKFLFGQHRDISVMLSEMFTVAGNTPNALEIRGSGSLVVIPAVSNSVYIQLRERD